MKTELETYFRQEIDATLDGVISMCQRLKQTAPNMQLRKIANAGNEIREKANNIQHLARKCEKAHRDQGIIGVW